MGASIFIGMNDKGQRESNFQRTGGFVNGDYWDAFGDLLDEVFLPDYPKLLENIKPEGSEYLKFYTFEDLSKKDFNLSIKLIRQHIANLSTEKWKPREYVNDMSKWQNMAIQVWEEIAEPYIVLDSRYDRKLANFL